jgi:excisionase family DNA binding protein
MSDVLTVAEVAERLDLNPTTVYRMLAQNRFPVPALRIGGRWKFSRRVLDAYLSQEKTA